MKYRIVFLIVFAASTVTSEDKIVQEYVQTIDELKAIKIKLQQDAMQHHEQLFLNLQNYGRAAGQVATSAILLVGQMQKKENHQSHFSKLSTADCSNIVQAVVAGFVLMVELARICHAKTLHKRFVRSMSYQDFVHFFPHLVIVQHQIILMKTLIQLSQSGNLGQQVFARIALVKMSLPYPFEKFANKAAKKMYKKSFDRFGNFIFTELSEKKDPYKKFTKKVAQHWKEIALRAQSFSDVIEPEYFSTVADMVDTTYNNSLIKIIHAGMNSDISTMASIKKQFESDTLIEKLFQFYVDQSNLKAVTIS